ncbi:cyclin-dependent protein kinase inhibitor SMR3 [Tripterygium wilfordii]|uniref:Cyclin-dependent protein kinase inhibitor SMR3 n=1 Tax=Tripterygium wilfordii TaxID=458696 RepID=A0A7J7CSS6_TRIWF|nr:cyclin-dependent protein kinase inhibitor SMR3-like [Tripterygium wilfordii]KAF5737165.1 cyclin-dependent protein kinase inhibitor SMR3 [Tripterygium wilfordii]
MCSVDQLSFLGMSSNSEKFVIKQGQEDKEIEFEISKREFQDKFHQEEANRDHDDEKSGAVDSPVKDVVEEDDGFKTPTSLDHKIPVEIECPPAPRKPKPSRKRKASSPLVSNRPRLVRLLDLSFTTG